MKQKSKKTPAVAYPDRDRRHFRVEDHFTLKIGQKKDTTVSNFVLQINSEILNLDGNGEIERFFEVNVKRQGGAFQFVISVRDFSNSTLMTRIMTEAGPGVILYGTAKDLRAAAMELSGPNIPVKRIFAGSGFDGDGNYHCGDLLVTPKGIQKKAPAGLTLQTGQFARNLGFLMSEEVKLRALAAHILNELLELKSHAVTYPWMAHIVLSPYASQIEALTGKEKPAMHLQGPSGCGKTFLGHLALAFFGIFDGKVIPWSSTANAIEAEGYHYKDSLFLVDDYKVAFVPQETIVRVFQNYAGGYGRHRLKSNSNVQDQRYIQGLLLSTGEDFVSDIESVTGRTICLQMEPEKHEKAGKKCWEHRHLYPMFLPGLIGMVISRPGWKKEFKTFVERKMTEFAAEEGGLSNGLRIACNWGLNAWAFRMFLDYLAKLGAIDRRRLRQMKKEYDSIVRAHLQDHAARLENESPAEIFFRIIGQKITAGAACINELDGARSKPRGRSFGFVRGQSVMVLPDVALEILSAHFRSIGQRMPFTKNSLRNALAQAGLIARPKEGRWCRQVWGKGGKRIQCWDFDKEGFKARVAVQ
ncbi:MAG TPA: DUF927 domain-containing protein [Thermodesulfobacteriota bacterium]|nr:DUF927 domain-containing protein [Thermodesulfobacteriota bacterium]